MLNECKLLWGFASEENISRAQSYPFHMVNFDYVLAYGKPKRNGLSPADDNVLGMMSDEDKAWLKGCIDTLCREESQEQAQHNDIAFMEAFERELEAELQKEQAREG